MFEQYYGFYKTYREKYGSKIAIFLMVGSFYELYDMQHKDSGESFCGIREICDILQIQTTIKQAVASTPVDYMDLFAGFPDYTLHKHASKLTGGGWTVIIVDQVKDKKGKVIDRKVQRILSPATHAVCFTNSQLARPRMAL
jgi:DNA mismatch repair ATPase MutS